MRGVGIHAHKASPKAFARLMECKGQEDLQRSSGIKGTGTAAATVRGLLSYEDPARTSPR